MSLNFNDRTEQHCMITNISSIYKQLQNGY